MLAAHEDSGLVPYDPDRFAERKLFAKAVDLLVDPAALAAALGEPAESELLADLAAGAVAS